MDRSKVPTVLSIAGSDSSGGAGIQADIKTITAHRLYAETAITAITAQNTLGVTAVQDISPDIVAAQIDAVFDDIRPSAVKIGMVSSVEIIDVIADRLSAWNATNVVVDPVMVATSGARLIAEDAAEALTRRLFPLATVITPNIPEAMALLDYEVDSERTQQNAAMLLTRRFGCASLVKGGHFVNEANDVLAEPAPLDDEGNHLGDPLTTWFRHKRIETGNTQLSTAAAGTSAPGMPASAASAPITCTSRMRASSAVMLDGVVISHVASGHSCAAAESSANRPKRMNVLPTSTVNMYAHPLSIVGAPFVCPAVYRLPKPVIPK